LEPKLWVLFGRWFASVKMGSSAGILQQPCDSRDTDEIEQAAGATSLAGTANHDDFLGVIRFHISNCFDWFFPKF
jgi:hypothetical protein